MNIKLTGFINPVKTAFLVRYPIFISTPFCAITIDKNNPLCYPYFLTFNKVLPKTLIENIYNLYKKSSKRSKTQAILLHKIIYIPLRRYSDEVISEVKDSFI